MTAMPSGSQSDSPAHAPRIVVIANPQSGGGRTGRKWGQIASVLRHELGPFESLFTEAQGDGATKAALAATSGFDWILIMGGDGTLGEAVHGLMGCPAELRKKLVVGLLPAGTGGDFRRTIDLPKRLGDAASALKKGKTLPLDVGKVVFTRADGTKDSRHFVNVAGFGISGVVDEHINRSGKRLPGKLGFFFATLEAQSRYINQEVRMRLDGGDWRTMTIHNVAVANGRYFGGGMKIAPNAKLDDGKLDIVTLGDFSRTEITLKGLRIYTGMHLTLDKVSHQLGSTLEAEPALPEGRIPIDVDGEGLGYLPAQFSIEPHALHLRVGAAA